LLFLAFVRSVILPFFNHLSVISRFTLSFPARRVYHHLRFGGPFIRRPPLPLLSERLANFSRARNSPSPTANKLSSFLSFFLSFFLSCFLSFSVSFFASVLNQLTAISIQL